MYFVYIIMMLAGALPLMLFFIRRKHYYHILRNGVKTTARVSDVKTISNRHGAVYDRVIYAYLPKFSNQYKSGVFTSKHGKYHPGSSIDIFYLPDKPEKNAMPGSKAETGMFVFLLAVFLFVLFACYKINEMVGNKEFHFNP